jgi:hypothetical protein
VIQDISTILSLKKGQGIVYHMGNLAFDRSVIRHMAHAAKLEAERIDKIAELAMKLSIGGSVILLQHKLKETRREVNISPRNEKVEKGEVYKYAYIAVRT